MTNSGYYHYKLKVIFDIASFKNLEAIDFILKYTYVEFRKPQLCSSMFFSYPQIFFSLIHNQFKVSLTHSYFYSFIFLSSFPHCYLQVRPFPSVLGLQTHLPTQYLHIYLTGTSDSTCPKINSSFSSIIPPTLLHSVCGVNRDLSNYTSQNPRRYFDTVFLESFAFLSTFPSSLVST